MPTSRLASDVLRGQVRRYPLQCHCQPAQAMAAGPQGEGGLHRHLAPRPQPLDAGNEARLPQGDEELLLGRVRRALRRRAAAARRLRPRPDHLRPDPGGQRQQRARGARGLHPARGGQVDREQGVDDDGHRGDVLRVRRRSAGALQQDHLAGHAGSHRGALQRGAILAHRAQVLPEGDSGGLRLPWQPALRLARHGGHHPRVRPRRPHKAEKSDRASPPRKTDLPPPTYEEADLKGKNKFVRRFKLGQAPYKPRYPVWDFSNVLRGK